MDIKLSTARLTLRLLLDEDAAEMFALDADQRVLQYLPEAVMAEPEEALKKIRYIQAQYQKNGIGRWAVIRKSDHAFLGWCGIKKVDDATTNGRTGYYDIGYRFLPQYWGQGYAFEAAEACLRYGLDILGLEELHATVMKGNTASARIVEKLGM